MPDLKTELGKITIKSEDPNNRTRVRVTPVFTLELIEKVGTAEAARLMGYSGASALSLAVKNDSIVMTSEVAAEGLLAKLEKDKIRKSVEPIVYVCKVHPDKNADFQTLARLAGVKLVEVQ